MPHRTMGEGDRRSTSGPAQAFPCAEARAFRGSSPESSALVRAIGSTVLSRVLCTVRFESGLGTRSWPTCP